MDGWTRQYRKRFDNPLWKKEVYCRGRAWDWLVEYACHTPVQIDFNGKIIYLKRGQLSYSVRFLGKRWKWSKSTVDRFLTRLKTGTGDGPMIETDTGTGQLIITICNYSIYQPIKEDVGTASETVAGTPVGTGAGQARDKEEDLEDKKKSSVSSLRSDTGAPPLSEIIFGQGLKFLCKSGVPERQARSVLGKWRKVHGDEKLLAALGKAQREGALDPVAFCEGVFRHFNGKPEPQSASDHIMRELAAKDQAAGVGR